MTDGLHDPGPDELRTDPDELHGPDPWSRWGWLLAAVWLVFLGFPAGAVVQATPDDPGFRAFHLGLIVAFGITYVLAFMCGQVGVYSGWTRGRRIQVYGGFAVLLAIMAVLWLLIQVEVLGMSAFLASLAAFAFPERQAGRGVVGVTVVSGLLLVLSGQFSQLWPLLLLPALIGGFGLLIRTLTRSDDKRQDLQRTLAVAAERDRVARDVHDVLGHSLTVISLKADLAERLLDRDPAMAKGEIADIQRLTRQSLAEIRATVAGLRVARLADERDNAADALRDAGITARLPEDGDVVDPGHRITIAWALREAVTNVIRHSGARQVDVTWGPTWLEVVDDGRGLRGRREGSGLTGLRERVRQSGGRIEITDGMPGQHGPGTTLRVDLS